MKSSIEFSRSPQTACNSWWNTNLNCPSHEPAVMWLHYHCNGVPGRVVTNIRIRIHIFFPKIQIFGFGFISKKILFNSDSSGREAGYKSKWKQLCNQCCTNFNYYSIKYISISNNTTSTSNNTNSTNNRCALY